MDKTVTSDTLVQNAETINGSAQDFLNNKVDEMVAAFAVKLFKHIETRAVYNEFSARVGSDKIAFYFLARLRAEIRPYVFKALRGEKLYIPNMHIFALLGELFEMDGIRSGNISKLSGVITYGSVFAGEFIKKIRPGIANIWNRLWYDRTIEGVSKTVPIIAVHIGEGIDTNKRSDIHWFPKSQIESNRVLLFINENAIEKKYSLFVCPNKKLLKELKSLSFKWVFVPQKRLTCTHKGVWAPKKIKFPEWADTLSENVSDGLDKWIFNTCQELLYDIDFWKSFLGKFNVKILFYPGEGSTTMIAQGIAFDMLGEKSGFTAGKQRSDIGQPAKVLTGYHTKDVVFTWNNRNPEYFRLPYNIVRTQIVSGHPNSANFSRDIIEVENAERQFLKKRVKFIIALFDSGHGNPFCYNFDSSEMENIYSEFLNWVLEDDYIGLLIKSKKPYILNNLPNIQPLLKAAEQTNRCVLLPFDCLPAQASRVADMVVGLAISSALSEAVIAGRKGIHFHCRFPEYHEYYKWGYDKLVFDDLDRMMNSLKSYKADRNSNPELGDWTPYLDFIDPFRDGLAGERMGTYFKWCLDGFDAGMNRDEVIKQANGKYADRWGGDKVISPLDI